MTDNQLMLVIGCQSTVMLVGIVMNVIWFRSLLRRMDRLIVRMDARIYLLMGESSLPGLKSN